MRTSVLAVLALCLASALALDAPQTEEEDDGIIEVDPFLGCDPCTPEAVKEGKYHHAYPFDRKKFVQCDVDANSYIRPCEFGSLWDDDFETCISQDDKKRKEEAEEEKEQNDASENITKDGTQSTNEPEKPTSRSAEATPPIRRPVVTPKTLLDEDIEVTIPRTTTLPVGENQEQKSGEAGSKIDKGQNDARVNGTFANPCTKDALSSHRFFHPYPFDSAKFIQCDVRGDFFVQSCTPPLVWDQAIVGCNRA